MTEHTFTPDLTGSDETLEALLERLRSFGKFAPNGRNVPPEFGHFVTSRRPHGGAGGAEAPISREVAPADLYAAA